MIEFTKREIAVIAAVIVLATTFVVVLTWFLVEVFAGPDSRDPLTKAGGLNPAQDIRKLSKPDVRN
jgi:hypothetical protein